MPRLYVIGTLLLLFLHYNRSNGQTSTDAENLREQLFVTNGYNRRIRPQLSQSDPTDIFIDFHLLALNEVNAVEETLRLTAYLTIKWTDQLLTWDPKNYGNLQSYHWPQNEVWKPVIALRNSYLDYKALGDATLDVLNSNTGGIVWMPFQVFTSTCSMKVTYYPFDKQICDVQFVAWGYSKDEVAMVGGDRGIVLEEFEPNPQWELLGSSWHVVQGQTDITITFKMELKRVPSYVIFTVLLPVLLLTLLNIFVFILPCESGERVGYAVTVFLSFAVFFTLISGVLPESVAIFTIYVIVMTAQSALICLIAIVQVRLSAYDEKEHPIPRWMNFVSNIGHCKCFSRLNRKRKVSVEESPVKILKHSGNEMPVEDVKNCETESNEDDSESGETWRNTISGIDYVLTVFFTVVSVAITSISIGICATA